SRLAVEQQAKIGLLAGIFRLAVTAQRSGVTSGAAGKGESFPQGLLLNIKGVEETPKIAARFSEGKHPLEHALGKTILIQFSAQNSAETPHEAAALPVVTAIRPS